jgi:hypothetical protein
MRVLFRLGPLGGQHLYANGGSCIALIFAHCAGLCRGANLTPQASSRQLEKKWRALGACTTAIKLKAE